MINKKIALLENNITKQTKILEFDNQQKETPTQIIKEISDQDREKNDAYIKIKKLDSDINNNITEYNRLQQQLKDSPGDQSIIKQIEENNIARLELIKKYKDTHSKLGTILSPIVEPKKQSEMPTEIQSKDTITDQSKTSTEKQPVSLKNISDSNKQRFFPSLPFFKSISDKAQTKNDVVQTDNITPSMKVAGPPIYQPITGQVNSDQLKKTRKLYDDIRSHIEQAKTHLSKTRKYREKDRELSKASKSSKKIVNPEIKKELHDIYSNISRDEDDLYKTIKLVVKIPKNSDTNLVENLGEASMPVLQRLANGPSIPIASAIVSDSSDVYPDAIVVEDNKDKDKDIPLAIPVKNQVEISAEAKDKSEAAKEPLKYAVANAQSNSIETHNVYGVSNVSDWRNIHDNSRTLTPKQEEIETRLTLDEKEQKIRDELKYFRDNSGIARKRTTTSFDEIYITKYDETKKIYDEYNSKTTLNENDIKNLNDQINNKNNKLNILKKKKYK